MSESTSYTYRGKTKRVLKDPRYRQNKKFHKFIYLVIHWKAPESMSSDFINWPLVPRHIIAWPQWWSFEDKSQLGVHIYLIWLSLTLKWFIKKYLNSTFKIKNHHSLSDLFHLKISVINILLIKVMPIFFNFFESQSKITPRRPMSSKLHLWDHANPYHFFLVRGTSYNFGCCLLFLVIVVSNHPQVCYCRTLCHFG